MRAFLAQVAELVDALGSGPSARKGVEVRVLSWAPSQTESRLKKPAFFFLPDVNGAHGTTHATPAVRLARVSGLSPTPTSTPS